MLYDNLQAADLSQVAALRRANDNSTPCRTGEDDMSEPGDFLNGATIEYGSRIPDDDGRTLDLFALKLPSGESYWFSGKIEFAENGYDYTILIGDFGALGRLSSTYKSFNKNQIMKISKFLEKYFLERQIQNFSFKDGNLLAFHFREKWIVEGNGELYEGSYGEFRPVG